MIRLSKVVLQISRLSVSSGQDALIVLHFGDNDLVCFLRNQAGEDRVGELVGVLVAHYEKYVLFGICRRRRRRKDRGVTDS